MNRLKGKDIISISRDLSREDIELIFNKTDELKKLGYSPVLKEKTMEFYFYEFAPLVLNPFKAAMLKSGGICSGSLNKKSIEIRRKERLIDTIKTADADVIVIKHYKEGIPYLAALHTKIPIVNAGDGNHEDPIQALTALYFIFKNYQNFKLGLAGDLRHNPAIHSLVLVLSLYFPERVKHLRLISPPNLRLKERYLKRLEQRHVDFEITDEFDLKNLDIVYMSQMEKWLPEREYQEVKKKYTLTKDKAEKELKEKGIIMTSLPKRDQIKAEVNSLSQAKYFEQDQNKTWIIMAVFSLILEE